MRPPGAAIRRRGGLLVAPGADEARYLLSWLDAKGAWGELEVTGLHVVRAEARRLLDDGMASVRAVDAAGFVSFYDYPIDADKRGRGP